MVNATTATSQVNGSHTSKKMPDLSHHINKLTALRQHNMLKAMYKYLEDPNIVSLGGGLPHPSTFPMQRVTFELPTPPNFDGTPYRPVASTSALRENGATHTSIKQNGHSSTNDSTSGTTMSLYKGPGPNGEYGAMDLAQAQQYARPMGFLPLLDGLRRLTELLHHPQYEYEQIPTGGNTDAATKVFRALLEPYDTLLVEEFEFAPPIAAAKAIGAGIRGMPLDTQGIVPEKLDEMLTNWDTANKGKKPHVMYTVPTGQNPTSATLTLERSRAVYAVAQKHDLIIVEDDPYYWLVLDPYKGPANEGDSHAVLDLDRVALGDVKDLRTFAKSLPRSYLSLDTDGRVLRLDSFSKCFAPGMRLGWLTGNPHFIERIQRISETDSQEVNGLTQAFFAQLLTEPETNLTNQSWGLEGFARWICDIRRQYTAKRDRLVNGITKACSRDLVRCRPVAASGMFLWLEINFDKHPDFRTNVRETSGNAHGPRTNAFQLMRRLWDTCIEEGVLILQSSIFASQPALPLGFQPEDPQAHEALQEDGSDLLDKAVFLRACFAGNYEQLDLASARLGKAFARFFENAV